MVTNVFGLCECGCGQQTQIANQTRTDRGWIKGQPKRFVQFHGGKGHKQSTETIAKRMATRTPETEAKRIAALRAAFKARPKKPKPVRPKYGSQEWRDKIGAAHKGRKFSANRCAAMSVSAKAAGTTPEAIERHKEARRLWWARVTPEKRAQMIAARSVGQKRRWAAMSPDERRAKIAKFTKAGAESAKAMWAQLTPEEKADKLLPVWTASQNANPSSIEETVAALLDSLGIKYKRQAYIGRCLVDFWLRDRKLVIECDGSYWHNLPGRPEQDAKRDAWLRSRGFEVLRLPEPLIKSGRAIDLLSGLAG